MSPTPRNSLYRFLPWLGPDGTLHPLKLLVLIGLFLPALWIAYALDQGLFGPRPINRAVHEIGLWTIRFLLLSLAITPLRLSLKWPDLILVRRMIGVAAFGYVALHLILYIADEKYDLVKVATEIVVRIYLTIGFVALLGLLVLAITSTDGMVRRLGARRWQRLHRLAYPVAILGSIHFFMQSKADVWEPMWMTGLFCWLMGYRLAQRIKRRRDGPTLPILVLLTIGAAMFTAVGEAVYIVIQMKADILLVLQANLSTFAGVRPSWIVFAAGMAVTILAVARQLVTGLLQARRARILSSQLD